MRAPATCPEMVNLYTPRTSRQTLINASLASVSEADMLLSTAEKKKNTYAYNSNITLKRNGLKKDYEQEKTSKIFKTK